MTDPAGRRAHLVYVTDTYCIWCWGFGASVLPFATANADRVEVEVVQGGLLTGDRVLPIREKKNARASTQRVKELCGVEFGPGYEQALDEGSIVLDSSVSTACFLALREQLTVADRPLAELETAHALQHAWYWEGADLADDAVLGRVAERLGADPAVTVTRARSAEIRPAVQKIWERRQALGVRGYPTLLLQTTEGYQQVGGPTSSPERLTACLDALLVGQALPEEPDDDRE